jgi:alcohol dehydrogenase class IV
VITDPRKNTKYTVNDFLIHPHFVVLDPELTLGLPPFFTAITAMDALSHAVEGYIGDAHCRPPDRYSEIAIQMIFKNIDKVYKNGGPQTPGRAGRRYPCLKTRLEQSGKGGGLHRSHPSF